MKKIITFVCSLLAVTALFVGCTTPTAAPTIVPTLVSITAPTAAPTPPPISSHEVTPAPTDAAATPADDLHMIDVVAVHELLSSMRPTNMEGITSWPTGLPQEVPAFKYGTLKPELSFKLDLKGTTAYAISYTGVTQDNIDAYNNALKENGFTVSSTDTGGSTTYSAVCVEKDGSMTMVVMMQLTPDVVMVEIMPNVKSGS